MDGNGLAEVIADSATAVYDYVESMQFATDPPMGVSVVECSGYVVGDGYALLHLEAGLSDTSGLMLMVDGDILDEESAGFNRYDEISRTIVVRPGEEMIRRMSEESPRIRVLTDMKFLILAVREFFRRYGERIRLPDSLPMFSRPTFPEGSEPSHQQVEAVETVLSNPLSYVWGAPGTGKTQYVLATCIRSCLESRQKVAVFAPTNNSVEQVLRGILKAFESDPELTEGIVRLGVPTKGFLHEHPEMCEDRQAQRRLERCLETMDNLEEVMFERCCDDLEEEVKSLALDAIGKKPDADGQVLLSCHPDLRQRFSDLCGFFSMRSDVRDIAGSALRRDFREVMTNIIRCLYERERPAAEIEEYESWEDPEIIAEMLEVALESEGLRSRGTKDRLEKARIIASTPQQFISRFRPKGSDEDSRIELDVDRIFLDEAGYCGLVQAAALFTNGVPVTFLGDHMQLPPVSQLDDEAVRSAAEKGGRLRDAYLWDMSALHCERLISEGPGSLRDIYLSGRSPVLEATAKADLTESHRFGSNLARVLDEHVYRNGMTGTFAEGNLRMVCLDATCQHREGRENMGEMKAIVRYLRRERPDPPTVAILTPYSVQARLLRSRVGRDYRDCVMTVHSSQGREWDTVIFSVADNGVESRDVPFRFTSSETLNGLRVVNTAVSRAKKKLVLVCDRSFWLEKKGELIEGLLREVPEEDVETLTS